MIYAASAMISSRRTLALSLALVTCGVVATARGQDSCARPPAPSGDQIDEARTEFLAGTERAEAHDWPAALDHFRRSYALSGANASLYNAAAAHLELGQHVEVIHLARCLLERSDLDAATRQRVDRLLRESHSQVATLSLAGLPPPGRALRIDADGRALHDHGARPLEIYTQPGSVALTVTLEPDQRFVWRGLVGAGETRNVRIALSSRTDEGGPDRDRGDEDEDPSDGTTVIPFDRDRERDEGEASGEDDDLTPWLLIGGGALAVAGAVVAIVLLTSSDRVDPRTDIVHEF
jgi:hypothetical protein